MIHSKISLYMVATATHAWVQVPCLCKVHELLQEHTAVAKLSGLCASQAMARRLQSPRFRQWRSQGPLRCATVRCAMSRHLAGPPAHL